MLSLPSVTIPANSFCVIVVSLSVSSTSATYINAPFVVKSANAPDSDLTASASFIAGTGTSAGLSGSFFFIFFIFYR
jgi:hypothetical protein